jgi:hypothetical protein
MIDNLERREYIIICRCVFDFPNFTFLLLSIEDMHLIILLACCQTNEHKITQTQVPIIPFIPLLFDIAWHTSPLSLT